MSDKSFYDWEKRNKIAPRLNLNPKKGKKENLTSIGIKKEELKAFLNDWKKNNLPDKT